MERLSYFFSKKIRDEARTLFKKVGSVKLVSEELGINYHNVRYWTRDMRKILLSTPEERTKVLELYKSGLLVQEVAEKLLRPPQTIQRWLSPFGVMNGGANRRTGDKNCAWNGGLPLCMDCGKKLTSYKGKRCKKCHLKKMPELFSGENSNNWRGGITPLRNVIRASKLYKEWRDEVFKRDNFTCQSCKSHGVRLHADHIKPFAVILLENNIDSLEKAMSCIELWSIENGRTLCKSCHLVTPTYGKKTYWNLRKNFPVKITN